MKKQIILLIFSLIAMACASLKRDVISKSTIKLDGKNTNIRDLIEIDGFYCMQEYPYSSCRIFFEDGLYVDQFSFKNDLSENEIKINFSKSIHTGIENKQVSWGFLWGVYKIVEDTLVVYKYLRGSFWTPWYLDEERYKIIDRKMIQIIYSKSLLKRDESYYENNSPWIVKDNYCFTPADSLLPSDCWLKEKKWIWRNEQDWENYMKMIKQKKNKKQ